MPLMPIPCTAPCGQAPCPPPLPLLQATEEQVRGHRKPQGERAGARRQRPPVAARGHRAGHTPHTHSGHSTLQPHVTHHAPPVFWCSRHRGCGTLGGMTTECHVGSEQAHVPPLPAPPCPLPSQHPTPMCHATPHTCPFPPTVRSCIQQQRAWPRLLPASACESVCPKAQYGHMRSWL